MAVIQLYTYEYYYILSLVVFYFINFENTVLTYISVFIVVNSKTLILLINIFQFLHHQKKL